MYAYQKQMIEALQNKNFKIDLAPARKSLSGLAVIKYCLAANKRLAIGTADVDALYDKVKLLHPEAKLTKHSGYLLVENE